MQIHVSVTHTHFLLVCDWRYRALYTINGSTNRIHIIFANVLRVHFTLDRKKKTSNRICCISFSAIVFPFLSSAITSPCAFAHDCIKYSFIYERQEQTIRLYNYSQFSIWLQVEYISTRKCRSLKHLSVGFWSNCLDNYNKYAQDHTIAATQMLNLFLEHRKLQ